MQARVLLAAGTLVALGLAWSNRFLQDDAYIVFHYARNLAEGRGLTWFGERIEGYTDFLWVLWIRLGISPRRHPERAISPLLCCFKTSLSMRGL